EPEGLDTHELYVNGLSTSLSVAVQLEFLHAVPGLERAKLTRPGYAIEYDYYPPTQLTPWLETKAIERLFFAGQINGTTGYEEAAAQGVVAGINAVRRLRGAEPVLFGRDEAYIGVLEDDLVTRDAGVVASAEIELKYDGYLARERDAARRLAELASFALPAELPYLELQSLATEARQKLDRVRPTSLAQAARIPGVSPSDLHNLVVETERWRRRVS